MSSANLGIYPLTLQINTSKNTAMFDILTKLNADIDAFLAETGMSPTAFGKGAVNDAHFVAELRNGREPRISTMRRAIDFMERQNADAS